MSKEGAERLARIVRDSGETGPKAANFWAENPRRQLVLGHFPDKGRGVIANETLAKGVLIERAPVIIIPANARQRVDETIIFAYAFLWEVNTIDQDMYRGEGRLGIPLGFSTLLNHSSTPNAQCISHIENYVMDVVALRDIEKGEEITVEYKMDLWF